MFGLIQSAFLFVLHQLGTPVPVITPSSLERNQTGYSGASRTLFLDTPVSVPLKFAGQFFFPADPSLMRG